MLLICSGSLIAANVVLTARHCVAPVVPAGIVDCAKTSYGAPVPVQGLRVSTHQVLTTSPGDYHAVARVVTPPAPLLCGNDFAILVLGAPVTADEAEPLVPRVDTKIAAGDGYSAVGYGTTDTFLDGGGQRRRLDGLAVACLAGACDPSYVGPGEWEGEKGICEGDSGGPALDQDGRVIGVTSRSTTCTKPVYGGVLPFAKLLEDTAVAAAAQAGIDPPPWAKGWPTDPAYSGPIGGPCVTPADCPSGQCLSSGPTSYCTRLCEAAAPCPSGTTCGGSPAVCVEAAGAPPVSAPKGGCSTAARGAPVEPPGWTGWIACAIVVARRLARGRASAG